MSGTEETVEQAAERLGLACGGYNINCEDAKRAIRRIQSLEAENAKLRAELVAEDRVSTQLIEDRDYANDALQSAHIALGGDGEWCAKAGQLCAPGETGDLALDVPVLAEQVKADRDEMASTIERARGVIFHLCWALEDSGCDSSAMLQGGVMEEDWTDQVDDHDEAHWRERIDMALGLTKHRQQAEGGDR